MPPLIKSLLLISIIQSLSVNADDSASNKLIDKSKWKLHFVSTQQSKHWDGTKAFDNNPKTFWHSMWEPLRPTHPHYLAIDLGQIHTITGWSYLTRQDRSIPDGRIQEGRIEISLDGKKWQPMEKFSFLKLVEKPSTRKQFFKKTIKGRYFRLVTIKGTRDKPYAAVAEINIYTQK